MGMVYQCSHHGKSHAPEIALMTLRLPTCSLMRIMLSG